MSGPLCGLDDVHGLSVLRHDYSRRFSPFISVLEWPFLMLSCEIFVPQETT